MHKQTIVIMNLKRYTFTQTEMFIFRKILSGLKVISRILVTLIGKISVNIFTLSSSEILLLKELKSGITEKGFPDIYH